MDSSLLFVSEVGVAEVAIQDCHVVADFDGFLVGADGFAEPFPLIPDGADVVLRVGVLRIYLLARARSNFRARPNASC